MVDSENRRWRAKKRLEELEYCQTMSDSRQGFYSSKLYVDSVLAGEPVSPSTTQRTYLTRRNASYPQGYIEDLRPILDDIPETLGSRSLRPHPVDVAIIADEFLYKSFDSTARLSSVTPENYRDIADNAGLLLIASTWRGLNGEWKGLATPTSKKRKFLLEEVVPYFRGKGTPVAFYSKEDPPNYSEFLSIAKAADHVFTCAEESVPDYARDCPDAASIGVLSFGVNPYHHSPVYSRRHRLPDVLFAGSWHTQRYPERRSGGKAIFDGVLESSRNLVIIDRNWSLENSRYFFPEEYLQHVVPTVEHDLLLKLQRISDFNINLNSVISSPSMYANRVVELQAMGSMVLSNYNVGVNNRFPNVLTAQTASDVREVLDGISKTTLYEVQMEGLRRVYKDHLAHDRMAEILEAAGLAVGASPARVCAVMESPSQEPRRAVQEQTVKGIETLTHEQLRQRYEEFDIAVPVSDRFRYAPTYVEDLVNAFKYADVDFVMKSVPGDVTDTDIMPEHESFPTLSEPSAGALWLDSAAGEAFRQGGRVHGNGYVLDPLGIARHTNSLSLSDPAPAPSEAILSVIVPVHNNGPFLLHKCVRSLERSSIFDKMEIILVDDGSTDLRTHQILDELAERHTQISVFKFGDTGSGSASRPRNKGLELATAPWVTYLDPDNEAIHDGYAKLVEIAVEGSLDIAMGDVLMLADEVKTFHNAHQLGRQLDDGSECGDNLLRRLDFYPMSIQAAVLNSAWLKGLRLEQPVGALGQDSFFFQQLIHYARRANVLEVPVHIYYGAVEQSVVNTIGPGFFRKYLPLEMARAGWLEEIGALEDYKATRAQTFMKHWFVGKLKQVAKQDLAECVEIIQQLGRIYEPITWDDAEVSDLMKGDTSAVYEA
ncbi:glycosyltransferase [Paenarthrobacter aurescens]|uniref:glycosyltransferase n=1 Tax=Paenarthrobacter aurescens TaxID=43663 RepID=UPI0021C16B1D|nr:glycosyltransferase [Paenarthrobacter aurescens]MCT9869158.1 glycosyltransferase [Paenarthrobacter aurescens]